jgi:hypothetical protein
MSIAEILDAPVTRAPLVPPRPPLAPDDLSGLGRLSLIRRNAIASWGQRAYEDDIIQGRFFGRSSFILNTPDAIRHVLVENYENYTRTPAGIRVLRPILGEGLLLAEGRAWKNQRRTLAPAFAPRAIPLLVPHMLAATDDAIGVLRKNAASRSTCAKPCSGSRSILPGARCFRSSLRSMAPHCAASLTITASVWRNRDFSICCCRWAGQARATSPVHCFGGDGRALCAG